MTGVIHHRFGWTLLLVLGLVGSARAAGPQLDLDLDKDQVDVGRVSVPGKGSGVVHFHNGGDQTLVIHKVQTTCGCTAAVLEKDRIEPGQSGQISVQLSFANAGVLSKTIHIESNAGNRQVTITGTGVAVFRLEPSSVYVQEDLPLGQKHEAQVKISSIQNRRFAIRSASWESGDAPLEGQVRMVQEWDSQTARPAWTLAIQATSKRYRNHRLEGTVVLVTDDPDQERVVIPVSLGVRQPLRLALEVGAKTFLGVVRPGDRRQVSLVLTSDDPADVQVQETSSSGADFRVNQVAAVKEGHGRFRIDMELTVPADAPEGFLWTRLTAQTDYSDQPQAVVSLSAHVIHTSTHP